jgi:hypothetical protein
MNRSRVAVLAALASVVAGCGGGDDSDQFREDYNAAVNRLSKINSDIGQIQGGSDGQSNDAIATEFRRIADTVEQTRGDLADLDPPEDAKDEFDELLTALQKGAGDLRSVADAAKNSDPAKANEAVQNLAATSEEITAAEDALKSAVDG